MNPGLFKGVSSPDDQRLQRIQDDAKQAFDKLADADDVLRVPVHTMVVSGAVPPGKSVVVFRGAAGQTLVLPAANAQGTNVSAVLVVVNVSANAVSVISSGADTVNGGTSISLAAGTAMVLTSDGQGANVG